MAPEIKFLQQSKTNGSCSIELLGERLELLPERAIYWPSQRALLVADLHWGKDEAFRVQGRSLPHGVLASDLGRLASCLGNRSIDRVYILGDLIHNRDGVSPGVIDQVSEWRIQNRVEMILVPGNHDRHFPKLPKEWNIVKTSDQLEVGPFTLVHNPYGVSLRYLISGHIHPLYSIRSRNDSITLPCFFFGKTHAILPAFSEFTGGQKVAAGLNSSLFLLTGSEVTPIAAR